MGAVIIELHAVILEFGRVEEYHSDGVYTQVLGA